MSRNLFGVNAQYAVGKPFHAWTEAAHDVAHGVHVSNIGHIAQNDRLVGQQGSRDQLERSIFVATGFNLTVQAVPTFNDKLLHM